jgi:hypothetical protein
MPNYLFSEGDLHAGLEGHAQDMENEIANAPEDHLLQADEDEWVSALVERYRLDAPELKRDEWWMDPPEEIKVDVRGDSRRAIFDTSRPALVNGVRVVVHVPFTGEADVFKLRPSTFTWSPPLGAKIANGVVVIPVEYPADAPLDVRAQAEGVLNTIDQWLEWARNDAAGFNDGLAQRARTAIQARRERVRQTYEKLQETGIPMRRPDESSKTYIADVVVRRPSPSIPPASSRTQSIALEPVLSDAVFEHILGVIRGAAEAMERSPKTYAGMGEEDRRQVLLAALNTHYRGQTTAEAFNVSGKTDILIRHAEGKNLFIGECKFWEGAKASPTQSTNCSATRAGATRSSRSSCSSGRKASARWSRRPARRWPSTSSSCHGATPRVRQSFAPPLAGRAMSAATRTSTCSLCTRPLEPLARSRIAA